MRIKNTKAGRCLFAIYSVREAYKKDLMLYINLVTQNSSAASKIYKFLLSSNYISERFIGNKNVVSITRRGRVALQDNGYNAIRQPSEANPQFNTSIKTQLERALKSSRIKLMLDAADAEVFEKPDIIEFYNSLNKDDGFAGKYFYTSAEFRRLVNSINIRDDDTFNGSKFYGVYFSDDKILVVYITDSGIIKAPVGVEEKVVQKINDLFMSKLNYFRRIEAFDEYTTTNEGVKVLAVQHYNKVAALVLCDGYSSVVAMSTGYKGGVKKGRGKTVDVYKQQMLTFSYPLYDEIYVVPCSLDQMYSLYYILNTTIEEYLYICNRYFLSDIKRREGIMYGSRCFLPAFECKTLNRIANLPENTESLTVYSYGYLCFTLSRCLQRKINFVNADNHESKFNVAEYSKYGLLNGFEKIRNNLLVPEKINFSVEKETAAHYGMTVYEMNEKLLNDETLQLEVISYLNELYPEPEKKKKYKKKSLTVATNEDAIDVIKQAAKARGLSTNRYILDNLLPIARQDIANHREYIKSEREERKKQ